MPWAVGRTGPLPVDLHVGRGAPSKLRLFQICPDTDFPLHPFMPPWVRPQGWPHASRPWPQPHLPGVFALAHLHLEHHMDSTASHACYSKRSNIPLIKSGRSSWFALPGPALQNLCTAQWVGTGVGVISGKIARDSHCSYSTLSNLSNVNASWVVVLLCWFPGVWRCGFVDFILLYSCFLGRGITYLLTSP